MFVVITVNAIFFS